MKILFLFLGILLPAAVWGGYFHILEQTASVNETNGLPPLFRYDYLSGYKPTVIAARVLNFPPIVGECSDVYLDLPFERMWPSNTTQPIDPTAVRIFLWRVAPPLTGSWARTTGQINTSWTFSVPMNGTWNPPRPLGLYRFHLNLSYPMNGGESIILGVLISQAGTKTLGQGIVWTTSDAANAASTAQFVDAFGNAVSDLAVAGQQSLWGIMPQNTGVYAAQPGLPFNSLAWNVMGQCSNGSSSPFGYGYLPAPNWTYSASGPSWPTTDAPIATGGGAGSTVASWIGIPSIIPPGSAPPSASSTAGGSPGTFPASNSTPSPGVTTLIINQVTPSAVISSLSPTAPITDPGIASFVTMQNIIIAIAIALIFIFSIIVVYVVYRRIQQKRRPMPETYDISRRDHTEIPDEPLQGKVIELEDIVDDVPELVPPPSSPEKRTKNPADDKGEYEEVTILGAEQDVTLEKFLDDDPAEPAEPARNFPIDPKSRKASEFILVNPKKK